MKTSAKDLVWNKVNLNQFLEIRKLQQVHTDLKWPDDILHSSNMIKCNLYLFASKDNASEQSIICVIDPKERFLIKHIKQFLGLIDQIEKYIRFTPARYILFVSKYTSSIRLLKPRGVQTFSKSDILVTKYHILQQCEYRVVPRPVVKDMNFRVGCKMLSTGLIARAHGFCVGEIIECQSKKNLSNSDSINYYIIC